MRSESELGAEGNEAFLDNGERLPGHAVAGDEQQIGARWHEFLMSAENLAQATLGSIAQDRIADSGDGRDDSDSTKTVGGSPTREPPKREKTAVNPAALFANQTKIALAANMLLRAKTHGKLTPKGDLDLG